MKFNLSTRIKLISSLLVLSGIICIYGAEATLHYLSAEELSWKTAQGLSHGLALSSDTMADHIKVAKQLGQPFDIRSRLEVIRDLENQGLHAYPPVTLNKPVEVQGKKLFPLGGIADVLTVYCNELGDYTIYHSDEHGFHNPRGLWREEPAQITILGESFTHGGCVSSDQNFVARIRTYYPKTLNLGMAGMTPLHKLGTLKEYASMVRPQLVLWVYYEGTNFRDLLRQDRSVLHKYLQHGAFQELFMRQRIIDEGLIETFRNVRRKDDGSWQANGLSDRLVRFVELEALRSYVSDLVLAGEGTQTRAGILLFKKILQEAARTTHSWKGRFVFVYLPQYERYTPPWLANPDRQRVLSMVTELGVEIIDLHPVFASQPDPMNLFPFRRRGHYDIGGHQLVGDTILAYLHNHPSSIE
jgi:hypothetical protein